MHCDSLVVHDKNVGIVEKISWGEAINPISILSSVDDIIEESDSTIYDGLLK